MRRTATFTVSLPFRTRKEGKYYVAWCYPLDVFSQGETLEKAKENLTEAVGLFITSCFERGTLEQVLKDCGFTVVPGQARPVQKKASKQEITVPVPFVFDTQLARCQG